MLSDIQKIDYDRYISSMFIDKEYRGQVAVILKLNIELSQIKNKVTEPTLGVIRLQWWHDLFDSLYNSPKKAPKHELTPYLDDIIDKNKENKLIKEDFDRLIYARERDFDQKPFKTARELLEYLSDTAGALNLIMAKIQGFEAEKHKELIEDISVAWGISAILRSANVNYSKSREIFPQDLATSNNIKLDDFGSYEFIKLSKPVVGELLDISDKLIEKSQEHFSTNKKKGNDNMKFLSVYLELAKRHNKKIRKNKYDVFSKGYRVELGPIELLTILFKV